MQRPMLLLWLTVGGMSIVALMLVTQVSGVSIDAAWYVFLQWTFEAGAVSTIAYLVLWRLMRKRDGLILKLPIGAHVCGVLSAMIATAAVRTGVVVLFGGQAAVNPEGGLQIFLFLVVPSALTFAAIKFAMLRMHSTDIYYKYNELMKKIRQFLLESKGSPNKAYSAAVKKAARLISNVRPHMTISACLSGWLRLWILLSLIWVVIVTAIGYATWPSESQAAHHPAYIYQLVPKQRELLAPDDSQATGLEVKMPNGYILKFRVGVEESAATPVARAYHDITVRSQADARSGHLRAFVALALIPCIVLAALGLGIAWVRRGFKRVVE